MPTHVTDASTSKYPVEQLKPYYKALLYMAELPKYWVAYDYRLEEFFDKGHPIISSQPQEFKDFCEAYEMVCRASARLDIEQGLNYRMLRALARNLYYGGARRSFYIRYLEGQIDQLSKISEPVTIVGIEERYQYYIYRKERNHKGLGIGPNFETWKQEGGCPVTFYSIMSYRK
ncbi:hypothetical protein IJH01_00835 [Candidatus Saccharibacteria bacterium]|nr:hypothetical protein [Candidatus Saccharibacteria bacterium]